MGQVRCHGSAVVGLCAVADGAAEGCFHAGPQPWDFAAGLLIVQEAGGTVTRLDGRSPGVFEEPSPILASNGRMHSTLLEWRETGGERIFGKRGS
jgi:myo-inositol-1(or 4)-monophosphatase